MGETDLESSLALFCGEAWIRESSALAYREADVVGVVSLYGPPTAEAIDELYLVFVGTLDSADDDAPTITRALAAYALEFAAAEGRTVRVEADEADAPLWAIVAELPAAGAQDLLLLAGPRA